MKKRPLRIGDIVTWRAPQAKGFQPLGVKHCEILEFGEAEGGQPAALINAMGHKVGALLRDLHLEEDDT